MTDTRGGGDQVKKTASMLLLLVLIIGCLVAPRATMQAAESWQTAYANILSDLMAGPMPSPWYEQSRYSPMHWGFFLHNIDHTGAPELFITIGTHYRTLVSIYTFHNGRVTSLPLPNDVFADQIFLPVYGRAGIVAHGSHAIGSFKSVHLVYARSSVAAEAVFSLEIGYSSDADDEIHTHLINDIAVEESDFFAMHNGLIGSFDERVVITQHELNEANIQNVIFFPITAPGLESASIWANDGINSAFAHGLIPPHLLSNYTQPITRAEFAALSVVLYEVSTGRTITERATFNDTTDINVEKMAGLSVVAGVGNGNFDPHAPLTREQAAVMLARLAYAAAGQQLPVAPPDFTDNAGISSWAYDAVGQVQAAGIMSGIGNSNFAPTGGYTREQSIITMLRMFDLLTERNY